MSAYEVSSSQAVLSPQRSKRVKENTPPRCAVLQNGSASNCPPPQGCGGGGWGASETEQASSTTRDHQHQHHVPRQTIIIPDTPSPAVSIITISSDTDEEDDHKQNNRSVLTTDQNKHKELQLQIGQDREKRDLCRNMASICFDCIFLRLHILVLKVVYDIKRHFQ